MSAEMKNQNSLDIDSITQISGNSNYAKLLGFTVIDVQNGKARISMKITEKLTNPTNATHGGAILSLADHTCGTAAMTMGPCVGGQFSVNFMSSPPVGEEIIAEAEVIHNGRRTRIIDVKVISQNDKLVAKGTAVAIVLK